MKRLALLAVIGLAALLAAGNARAYSVSIDVPTRYTFGNAYLDNTKSARPVDRAVDSTRGFKLLLTGNSWFGIGYERYEVDAEGDSDGGGRFAFTNTYQFYDVFLDLPTRVLNFTLGYGMGTVNTQFGEKEPARAESADANQWFASIGYPFGPGFDLHLAYHQVSSEDQKLSNVGISNQKANFSGSLYMAGIRLGW